MIVFGGAAALYIAMMAVTWIVGTRQAEHNTEAMLDYAVNDMRLTLDGTIDTVMEHLASTTVRHFKKPAAHSLADITAVAAAFDIYELCLIDRTGLILATNDSVCRLDERCDESGVPTVPAPRLQQFAPQVPWRAVSKWGRICPDRA